MTNPPVPATPLDVEACVRLLERLADSAAGRSAADRDYAEGHERSHASISTYHFASSAKYMEEAKLLRALASALPGMGKMAKARDAWREFAYHVAGCVECGQTTYTDCFDGNALHDAAKAADDVLDHPIRSAARAAQPQETSADATQDCYACGHARVQHLNESNELDDCLDCHCSEFMQSPASSPSPERE